MQDKNSYSSITRLKLVSPTTDKSLKMSNYVQQVTSFDPPAICTQHYHDSIGYICIDCRYKCLCGTCLQEGSHKTHHIKNIEKGSKIIDRALNQALIRLRSKSDLLTNLKDYMKIRKSEIFQQYKQYQQTFKINFDSIMLDLEQKRSLLNQHIDSYAETMQNNLEKLIEQINQQSFFTLQLINAIEDKVSLLSEDPISVCLFYEQKNLQIQAVVDQATKKFEFFKKQAPNLKWAVDLEIFDDLKDKIKSLGVETNQNQIKFICNFYSKIKQSQKKKQGKNDKIKNTYFIACKTPKNLQLNRNTTNNFRSPPSFQPKKQKQGGRLNSMPVSPSKQKSLKKKSPGNMKIQQVTKKFKKAKK